MDDNVYSLKKTFKVSFPQISFSELINNILHWFLLHSSNLFKVHKVAIFDCLSGFCLLDHNLGTP